MEPPNFKKLLTEASALVREGKNLDAEMKLGSMIDEMKAQLGADNPFLAEAYRTRCFARLGLSKRARVKKAAWLDGACDDYEKAVAIFEQGESGWSLSGNMTNLGSLLYRAERYEDSLVYHQKALAIAERLADPKGVERLAAWNQLAGTLLMLDRLDEAEAILLPALVIVPEDYPARAFLLNTLADVQDARSAKLKTEAERLGANASCGLPSRPADVPVTAEEACAEFRKLYVKPGSGIVGIEMRTDGSKKLDVSIDDGSKVKMLQSYRGFILVYGYQIAAGAVLQPGGLVEGPGPELRRQT